MSGIVGSTASSCTNQILSALGAIRHRGPAGSRVVEKPWGTLAQLWTSDQATRFQTATEPAVVMDGQIHNWRDLSPGATSPLEAVARTYEAEGPEFLLRVDGQFALAIMDSEGVFLARDPLGVVPLYFATGDVTCFASEVKAFLKLGNEPTELPPGHYYHSKHGLASYAELDCDEQLDASPEDLAVGLRHRLVRAVGKPLSEGVASAWLSGGLDSSAIAALAQQQTSELHTFAIGLEGAPDLEFAGVVAGFIGSRHHEHRPTRKDLVEILPQVIYHLESFDALLVRSSMVNFLAGKMASDYAPVVFSGEGSDELFAGYDYLQGVTASHLAEELLDLTLRLHNTALQRVDRCSRAHGLRAYLPFLDREVVSLALRIPTRYKLSPATGMESKWILRAAMEGLLPSDVLHRPKAKFWEGAGVEQLLADAAEEIVSDADLKREQKLPDGSLLQSKEELLYYRLFRETFGDFESLEVVGRTKRVPTAV